MRLAYHPLVQRDVNGILRHYDKISPRLGDEFWTELMRLVELVATKPGRFHIADRGLRRANMRRFPYHVLFRESPVGMKFCSTGWFFSLILTLSSRSVLTAQPVAQVSQHPMPSQVAEGITSWLWLCNHLGINPGTQTNLAGVDWEHSFTATNSSFSAPVRNIQVHFMNGVVFDMLGPFAISHFAQDAAFVGRWEFRSQAESARFYGTVEKDWRQLAKALQRRLVQDVGISPTLLAQFSVRPTPAFPEVGSYAMRRLVVQWRRNGSPLIVDGRAPAAALTAEFDLGTGELKFIQFGAPDLINAMARVQKNVDRSRQRMSGTNIRLKSDHQSMPLIVALRR